MNALNVDQLFSKGVHKGVDLEFLECRLRNIWIIAVEIDSRVNVISRILVQVCLPLCEQLATLRFDICAQSAVIFRICRRPYFKMA